MARVDGVDPHALSPEDQDNLSLCLSYLCPKEPMDVRLPQNAILVFDTETTGLSKNDEVIQLGYVIYRQDGSIHTTHERIWQTNTPSNHFAQRVHGISDKHVRESKYQAQSEFQLFKKLVYAVHQAKGKVVAHNAEFDRRLLHQTAKLFGETFEPDFLTCTENLCRRRVVEDRGEKTKNEAVYKFLGGPDLGTMHTALVDCKATAFIYFHGRKLNWW